MITQIKTTPCERDNKALTYYKKLGTLNVRIVRDFHFTISSMNTSIPGIGTIFLMIYSLFICFAI